MQFTREPHPGNSQTPADRPRAAREPGGSANGRAADDAGGNPPLALALAYRKAGLSVIPIRPDGTKAPAVAWKPYQQRIPQEREVRAWWRDGTCGLAIICGGVSGNLETIDIDRAALFAPWQQMVEAECPGLFQRLSVARTPNGYHVRYRCTAATIPGNTVLAREPGRPKPLVETRGAGGYALAPGCPAGCHETGRLYEHNSGPPLTRLPDITAEEREVLIRCARSFDLTGPAREWVPPAAGGGGGGERPGDAYSLRGPDWGDILGPHGWTLAHRRSDGARLWRRPGKDGTGWSAITGYCKAKDGADLLYVFSSSAAPFEAGRCYRKFAAFALLDHGGDFGAAAKDLAGRGYGSGKKPGRDRPGPRPGWHARDVAGEGHGAAAPDVTGDDHPVHLTDLGNARRLVARHGKDLRHVRSQRTFLCWDGRRWAADVTGQAERWAKDTVAALYDEAAQEFAAASQALKGCAADDPGRAALKRQADAARKKLSHALDSEDARRLRAILAVVWSEPGIAITTDQLDRGPYLLNVQNGTLDLMTGALREHRREDLITKLAPVAYEKGAQCPLWERCLNEWMGGRPHLVKYLQRVVGHSLSADVSEQCIWIFHGPGENGKSTFLGTLLAMVGDYGMQAVSELLLYKRHESHSTERADLFGKRLVCTIEVDQGKRLAEALMKQMTGGDRMRARNLYRDHFEFDQTWKIIMGVNHKPELRGTDHATWRRIKLVPWNVVIPPERKDKHLPGKLKAELPGILAWSVRGFADWKANGMQEPPEVTEATNEYRKQQDTLARFLADCCHVGSPDYRCKVSVLWEHYRKWSSDEETSQIAFGRNLEERGFAKTPPKKDGTFWIGIGLRQ
jgi:putative DNA primase/helicase